MISQLGFDKRAADLFKKLLHKMEPPPRLLVSEWADNNRVIPDGASAEPGKWRTSRTPYLKEIMDCMSAESRIQEITFVKGAQVGGSESANNWIGYVIDQNPAQTLLVQPTVDLAKKYSSQRIAPMINSCPALKEKVRDSRSRDSGNTMLVKNFTGGFLVLTGANSAAGLRSYPVQNIILDEVDAYPSDVEGEGDPVGLAKARSRTFSQRKHLLISTPTEKETSRIWAEYEKTDQRRFFVPCPDCGHYHFFEWANFNIPKDERGKKMPEKAHMVCPECGSVIEEQQKEKMLESGEWRPTKPENISKKRRGYHISTLYSIGFFRWEDCAEKWIEAQGNDRELQVFINTILGEPWEDKGEQLEHEQIMNQNRVEYGTEVPDNVLILTAGVDVQDDRLEVEIVGWGHERESWGIEYKAFYGKPTENLVWEELDHFIQKDFSYKDGHKLNVACTFVDSGGHCTSETYAFTKKRESRRVFSIKGVGGAGLPLVGRATKNNRLKANLFLLGVDTGKVKIFEMLRKAEPGSGFCHFPMGKGYDEAYFKGLTSEKRVLKYSAGRPRYEWKKKSGSVRNEPLDVRNYALAALELLDPNFQLLSSKDGLKTSVKKKKRRIRSNGVM